MMPVLLFVSIFSPLAPFWKKEFEQHVYSPTNSRSRTLLYDQCLGVRTTIAIYFLKKRLWVNRSVSVHRSADRFIFWHPALSVSHTLFRAASLWNIWCALMHHELSFGLSPRLTPGTPPQECFQMRRPAVLIWQISSLTSWPFLWIFHLTSLMFSPLPSGPLYQRHQTPLKGMPMPLNTLHVTYVYAAFG